MLIIFKLGFAVLKRLSKRLFHARTMRANISYSARTKIFFTLYFPLKRRFASDSWQRYSSQQQAV